MEEYHKHTITSCHRDLCDDLDVTFVLDFLHQEKLFSIDDFERVKLEHTPKDKRCRFLFILQTKGPTAFNTFLDALWESEGQRHLHSLLKEQADKNKELWTDDQQGMFIC